MKRAASPDPPADPFGERRAAAYRLRLQLLGGAFEFSTDQAQLARLVSRAYAGLPRHRLPGAPLCRVRLVVTPDSTGRQAEPPQVHPVAAPGIVGGVSGKGGAVFVAPEARSALVVVPHSMLPFPYHVRYELLEFAVYMLAGRTQGLLPLHGACVGRRGTGALLLGSSGAGKSTLALQCLLQGMDFLAEDSVLVKARGLLATGVSNFLHLRADALRFVSAQRIARSLARSPVIRRRSGVAKLEIDLRRASWRLAAVPLRLCATLFVSPRSARGADVLRPLPGREIAGRLCAAQQYAAQQPGWDEFLQQMVDLPGYELLRGRHPREAVEAVAAVLRAARLP